jgi:hypothetical protein
MGVYDVRKTILESVPFPPFAGCVSHARYRSIAWELPGNIPYEAKTRLINQFTILWSTPAVKCVASINDVLDDVIQQLAKTHFGRFRVLQDTILYVIDNILTKILYRLYLVCRDFVRPDIEECKDKAFSAVKETLGLEITPIYTQNKKDFENLREGWLIKYRKARRNPGEYRIPESPCERLSDSLFVPIAQASSSPSSAARSKSDSAKSHDSEERVSPETLALQYLARAGYRGLTVDDLARLSRDKYFEDELIVMADVRAYFTLAYKVRDILGTDAKRG